MGDPVLEEAADAGEHGDNDQQNGEQRDAVAVADVADHQRAITPTAIAPKSARRR